jgi:hypothetical protein
MTASRFAGSGAASVRITSVTVTVHGTIAATAPLAPSADTYLREGPPNQNQGADTILRLQNSGINRAPLMWDPTVIAQAIGAGTVTAARIELTISDNGDNWGRDSSGRTIDLHRMTRAWTESGATWNCAVDSNPMNQRPDCAGATAWEMGHPESAHPWAPTPTATQAIHNGQRGVVTFDVTADVAGMVTGGGAQHGWILKKTNERANGRVEFGSRESASAPRLVLTVQGALGALVSIVVTPNPANVNAGGTVQFAAVGLDAAGLVVPTPGLVWSVMPAVGAGTINGGSGLFTAGLVSGTFINAVRAASGAISGYASVIVDTAPPGLSLGAAETHGILAGSAVTCIAGGTVNADVSVAPGSAIIGFPPCTITGAVHAADTFALAAQGDLTTAFLALEALPCGTTIAADLGGTTLAPGVYCSGSSVGVTGAVTLDGRGDANARFVIRAGSTLTTAGSVVLIGGAQAKNVYWWVGSSATLGVGSVWQGNILALTSITLNDAATLLGRALARNGAVRLGTNNTITLPSAIIPSDSVFVRITLLGLPSALTFNQSHVPTNYAEYWWGIRFNTDGNASTGLQGYDVEIALVHPKQAGNPFQASPIQGTQHQVIEWVDTAGSVRGYVRHNNVEARIDPADSNTLIIAVPRSWAEIARIDELDDFYIHTIYYAPSPPIVSDRTSVAAGTQPIADPAGDIAYAFVDIVLGGWNTHLLTNLLANIRCGDGGPCSVADTRVSETPAWSGET